MINSKPIKGQNKKEIVEDEVEPTLFTLINKLIKDGVEKVETSTQWINELKTFFSIPEDITRWQEILSDYASTTTEFNNLNLPESIKIFGKIIDSQVAVREEYSYIKERIGYFDLNKKQNSSFINTYYYKWAKNRITTKRLKIIRKNMEIIEDE